MSKPTACAPLPAALVGDNESFESIPGGQEGASKLAKERIRKVNDFLVTRAQFIEEAKRMTRDAITLAGEDMNAAFWTQEQAKVYALVAIADALDALLCNGIVVERP